MKYESIEGQQPLIKAKNLKKYFVLSRKSILHAVDDVSFEIREGETLGLVGESGCGKSTVGNLVMRLLPHTFGELHYRGQNIFDMEGAESRDLRKKMQIIFQDPYSSLNPRKTIKRILSEVYEIHKMGTKAEIEERVYELCEMVDLPKNLLDHYPHELDGGMRQVVSIARALSMESDFIVCDEPVSSLDVSVQAKIINLLMDLQKKLGLAYLFISHDLSVVRHISNRVAIMYLGQIVEIADTDELFSNTLHPYSIALLSAVPSLDLNDRATRIVLKDDVPSPVNPEPGCRFATRCWMAKDDCSRVDPPLKEVCPGHYVACFYAHDSQSNALELQQ